jgi:Zn-finger nucleic acid-binding protein
MEFEMKCPHCPDSTLVMSDRQGVEIDYCPQCRGIWLDRGELDKLLERAAAQPGPALAAPRRPDFVDSDFDRHRGGQRRRKSWLHEIFD